MVGEVVLPVVVDLSLNDGCDVMVVLVEIGHWRLRVDVVVGLGHGGSVALLLGFGTI